MLKLYYVCWWRYRCLHHRDDFTLNICHTEWGGKVAPARLIMLQMTTVNVDLQSSVICERAEHGF